MLSLPKVPCYTCGKDMLKPDRHAEMRSSRPPMCEPCVEHFIPKPRNRTRKEIYSKYFVPYNP
jgi:hypothetical protein